MATLNRDEVRKIIQEIKTALVPICQKWELTLANDSGRFEPTSLRVTLELACLSADGENLSEKRDWDVYARLYGVKPEDRGKVIVYSDMRRYKLVAIEPKRSRYPFVGEDQGNGKRYKLTAEGVRWGLEQLAKKAEVQS